MFAKWIEEDQRFAYDLHDNGGVEISADAHAAIIAAGAAGKVVSPNKDGFPIVEEPPPLTAEQLGANALMVRDHNLQLAAAKIAPLQDAADLGMATPVEDERLRAWKLYRVALNRIDQQEGFPVTIQWPQAPAG